MSDTSNPITVSYYMKPAEGHTYANIVEAVKAKFAKFEAEPDAWLAALAEHDARLEQANVNAIKMLSAATGPYRAEVDTLADLLDGVLADDPQAIRDAALWLTVNRPEGDNQ